MTASSNKPRPIHEIRQEASQTNSLSSKPPPPLSFGSAAHPPRGICTYLWWMYMRTCQNLYIHAFDKSVYMRVYVHVCMYMYMYGYGIVTHDQGSITKVA